jgi:hypothetical protein
MLTSKELMELGFKPGPELGLAIKAIKSASTREEAITIATELLPAQKEKVDRKPHVPVGSVLEWLLNEGKHLVPPFLEQRKSEPSNSEIRRLLENRSILLNGFMADVNSSMDNQFPIWQLIFFPKAHRRCTLVDDLPPIGACDWFNVNGELVQTISDLMIKKPDS